MTMLQSTPSANAPSHQAGAADNLLKGFSSLSSRLTSGFKEAGIGVNFDNLVAGIKNFVPQNKDLTLTRITESLCVPVALDPLHVY